MVGAEQGTLGIARASQRNCRKNGLCYGNRFVPDAGQAGRQRQIDSVKR